MDRPGIAASRWRLLMIGVLDTSRSPPTTKFFGRVVMVLPFNIRLPLTDKLSGRVVRCLQLFNFKSPTTDKFSGNFSIAESDKKIDLLNFEFSGNSLIILPFALNIPFTVKLSGNFLIFEYDIVNAPRT